MAYEKRVCVLKQIKKGFSADGSALSGAVYAERLGTQLTVTPRIPAIAPVREGRYVLVLRIEEKIFVLALRGSESLVLPDAPSIKGGFAALLAFVRTEAEPVAFGNCGIAAPSYADLLSALSEAPKKERKAPLPDPLPPNELPTPLSPNVPRAPTIPVPGEEEADPLKERAEAYDDEAIASSDYFRPSDHANASADVGGEGEEKAAADAACGDDGASPLVAFPRGTLTYYHTVRARIRAAFEKYPRDERLLSAFPHSEWVKSENALIGVIYKNGAPEYLCVAVEAHGDPPAEMKARCCFVPAAPYNEKEGFYVVFQSADTGEYVTVSEA